MADTLSRLLTNQSYKEKKGALQGETFLERRVFEDQVSLLLDLGKITDLQQDDEQLTRMLAKREVKEIF